MNKNAFVCDRHGRKGASRFAGSATAGHGQMGSKKLQHNSTPKLDDLLHCLRSNSFIRLPIYRKKAMLDGLLEMLRQGREAIIKDASLRILGDKPLEDIEDEEDFPAQLIEIIFRATVLEANDAIRSLLWAVLMKMDAKPENYILPKDFVREFWSEEPIGRANVIKFLLERFKVDEVLEAVDHYVPEDGRKMPVGSCWSLIRYAKTERTPAKRASILRRMLRRSEIPAEKATVFFSEVMKSLDRFSLIEVFSGRSIDQVPANWPNITPTQLELAFTDHGAESIKLSSFRKRLNAIEIAINPESAG